MHTRRPSGSLGLLANRPAKMSLVLPGTMLFAVFGAGSAGVAWVLFTPQAKRNDRRYAKRASREFSARTGRVGESVRLGPNFPAPLGPAPRPVNTHGIDRRGHLPHELREMWATAAQRPAAWAGSLPRRASLSGARAGSGLARVLTRTRVLCVSVVSLRDCSLVVQMAITATVCMWLMCAPPATTSRACRAGHGFRAPQR